MFRCDDYAYLISLLALQGCLICLTLAFGWACAAYVRYLKCCVSHWLWLLHCYTLPFCVWYSTFFSSSSVFPFRNREIKRMKDSMKCGNNFAFLCHDIMELEHSNQVNLPRVSIVMPLKGFGEHNLHNWRSQVRTHFCVFFQGFGMRKYFLCI